MRSNNYLMGQFRLLFRNFFSLILFEFIFKALGTYYFFPFLLDVLRDTINMEVGDLLTIENIQLVLASPRNIFVLLFILLCISYYFLFEISVLLTGFKFSQKNKTINIFSLVFYGFLHSLRFFKIKNWIAFILILFFLPVLHFGLTSGISSLFYFKDFIDVYIGIENVETIFTILIFLVTFVIISFCFSFVFFIEYRVNMLTSCLLCFKLYASNFFRTFIKVISVISSIILLTLLGLVVGAIAIIITYEVLVYTNGADMMATSTAFYRNYIELISPIVVFGSCLYSVFITSFFFAGIYNIVVKEKEVEPSFLRRKAKKGYFLKTVKGLVLSGILIFYSLFQGSVLAANITDDSLIIAQTGGILTGHRGNVKDEVQNTAASFESAIQNGAEYIELDVRKTSDGVIVVSHDDNLENLTGKNINISETPYEELTSLVLRDVGRDTTPNQHLLTLDEAIALVGDRAKLNIEIKQVINGDNYIPSVLEVIKSHGIEYECFVSSSNYTYLFEVETIDPEIDTLFITDSGSGDLENLGVDGLSLSTNAASEELIKRVHLRGKLVHAWILEDKEDIVNMINMNVDYLITNDIRAAQSALAELRPSNNEQLYEVIKQVIIHS